MLTFSLINNRNVQNGNEDYWTRLGAILKENQDLGISNEIYANLVLPINNGAWLESMLQPKPVYQRPTNTR